MKHSLKTGFSFGMTSGVITTLGLMVGLHSGTNSRLAVIGGILTIAIADAFSDALGIHVSEEYENVHTEKEIWASTISTFIAKFAFALTFLVPAILLPLGTAIIVSVAWGLLVLAVMSHQLARAQKTRALPIIAEHLGIAIIVIIVTHYVGDWIAIAFR
jgi:VIT1/CCC1 family predicted Fe2+/Mn2+ transporter